MKLCETIRRLRTEKGWSQEMLAEHAYVSRQTVSNWETEKSYPDVHSLLILSDLFGVSLDELIKGDVEIMKSTIQNEDASRLRNLQWRALSGFFGLMIGVTLLIDCGGEIGRIIGSLFAGILSVCIFMTFREMEQIKQRNDIETYREVLAFQRGETLDDIEKEREQKKRKSQKTLLLFVSVLSGVMLLFCAVVLILECIRL